MRFSLVLSLCVFLLIIACEQDDDIYIIDDPYVTFQFINGDSLNQITDSLHVHQNQDTLLLKNKSSLDSSLKALSDSINVIQLGIDTGNLEHESLQLTLKDLYSADSTQRVNLLILISENDDLLDSIQSIITDLKKGLCQLESIEAVYSGFIEDDFTDSVDYYQIPLNIHDTLSNYIIRINGQAYSIALSHDNEEAISSRQTFFISISDVRILEHDFTKVVNNCGTQPCKSNAAIFTWYY